MLKSHALPILVATALLISHPLRANAQTFNTSFSGTGFSCFNSGTPGSCGTNSQLPRRAEFVWNAGDFYRQTVTGSGLSSVDSVTMNLNFFNFLFDPSTESFDVVVNGVVVGQTPTFLPNGFADFTTGPLSFSFAAQSGPTYTVDLRVRQDVELGSLGLYAEAVSTLQLSVTAVPEPSTYALFGSGLIALALIRRRRQV
jgi:PEP-CTERM motif